MGVGFCQMFYFLVWSCDFSSLSCWCEGFTLIDCQMSNQLCLPVINPTCFLFLFLSSTLFLTIVVLSEHFIWFHFLSIVSISTIFLFLTSLSGFPIVWHICLHLIHIHFQITLYSTSQVVQIPYHELILPLILYVIVVIHFKYL